MKNLATKEVYRYRQALQTGYQKVLEVGLITTNHLVGIQGELLQAGGGVRRLPGTNLVNSEGKVVYSPPQDHEEIMAHLKDLEVFINFEEASPADPIIKMALIHHQFESIHPFYDGNGRTGRILNVLYLVKEHLLSTPILYLSRPLVRTKDEYYRRLQAVREQDAWEDWVRYMLGAVQESARETVRTVEHIWEAQLSMKHRIRERYKFYSQDLLNNLFSHPYTKIEFLTRDLNVSRLTATRYLDTLSQDGFLQKAKLGRSNYYINTELMEILIGADQRQ